MNNIKNVRTGLLCILSVLFYTGLFAQSKYITVDASTYSDEELIKDVLIDNPCAFVDNVYSITGEDYSSCSSNGISYFQNPNPEFPIAEGVMLSTGQFSQAPGPWTSNTHGTCLTGPNGWSDDQQLSQYINDALNVNDTYNGATLMEFEFTPVVNSVSFNFVFASNEYGSFQCGYSDPFAFFLENSVTGEIVNMALVPNTADPISVLTIRDEQYNTGCASDNEQYFDKYYGTCPTPNCDALPVADAPINFKGHSVLMTASSEVTPFTKYRMKMVIQNRSDNSWDSAVFLEAGSFDIGDDQFLGADIEPTSENAVCSEQELVLDIQGVVDALGGNSDDIDIIWMYEGNEISGETSPQLTVTEAGNYSIEVANPQFPDCTLTDDIDIEFKQTPELPAEWNQELTFCDDFQTTLLATPTNLDELNIVSYEWYKDGVQVNNSGSTLMVEESGEYTVVVSEVDCSVEGTINIIAPDFSVDLGDSFEVCDSSGEELVPALDGIADPSDATYLWNTGATTPTLTVEESGFYEVEVTYQGCTETGSIQVNFKQSPNLSLGENFKICSDDTAILTASAENLDANSLEYTWYLNGGVLAGETGSSIEVNSDGTYRVEASQQGSIDCIGSDVVEVTLYANENCVITQGLSPNTTVGENDCLDLLFLSDRTGITNLTVFNRHGRVIYEKGNYSNSWCGQDNNGNELPTGTYYYVLELGGDDPVFGTSKKGWIYINNEVN